ncbi:Pyridoxal-5'-phosphate-dependent protein subunit beta [Streptomyces bingchenggensis BCW-1]|uniref:Pyridoxal-5'-phosphate-dependent protein subunit beta n=1 Tax=Streptomyces bingchenggensis (strain BCW-1) TaxID=749414 RepID=D7C9N8_STRBB|nr:MULTISPECIES: pyridoxal-5'-phosphate-dependent protein subunit beta [Streptomyces]ADI12750.1 Pyridoxal-5'-phosphate-dependent protein subunit beta [Streptomyces bingchenggensis BCW-1]
MDLDVARIEQAAQVIDPVFLNTPQYLDEQLCQALGGRAVTVKLETAEVFVPEPVNPAKRERMETFGARVIVAGADGSAARRLGRPQPPTPNAIPIASTCRTACRRRSPRMPGRSGSS